VSLCWSERQRLLLISSILQVVVQQFTDGHDSEHRGPAVVASATVSWNRGDDRRRCVCCLTREIALISSTLQVLARQSTDGHDSKHREPAVVACGPVSWSRGDGLGDMLCGGLTGEIAVDFVDFCRYLSNNQLSGTISSTVGQLSLLKFL
jgi:hypothetical protein